MKHRGVFCSILFSLVLTSVCPVFGDSSVSDSGLLLNVDFTAHLNPAFSVKTGLAAAGHSTNDFWNVYSRDVGNAFQWRAGGAVSNLLTAEKRETSIDLTVSNAEGAWVSGSTDAMMGSYLYPSGPGDLSVRLDQVPPGTYDLYVYAHGLLDAQNSIVDLRVGNGSIAEQTTGSGPSWNSVVWEEGRQYVVFHAVNLASETSLSLAIRGGVAHEADLNGLQLMEVPAIAVDTQPPIIVINSPTNGLAGSTINLDGTITDNTAVAAAHWWLNNGVTQSLVLNNNHFGILNIPVNPGTNFLHVSAQDGKGNQSESTIQLMRVSESSDTNVIVWSNLLVNVDFTAHLNPAFSIKTGPAAVGHGSNDFWNVYSRDIDSEFNWRSSGLIPNLFNAENQSTGIALSVTNAEGAWFRGSTDAMMNSYLYPSAGGDISVTLWNMPSASYDLYVYAHGQPDQESSVIELSVNGIRVSERSTGNQVGAGTEVWRQGRQFVVFHSVNLPPAGAIGLKIKGGVSGLAIINGLQLSTPAATNIDTENPVITLTSPTSGTNSQTAQLSGTIVDNVGVDKATWALNQGPQHNLVLGVNGEFNVNNIELAVGTNRFQVEASDIEDNKATATAVAINTPIIPSSTNVLVWSNLLVNVDFTAHLNPAFSIKTGPAAVGHGSNDFWNVYSRDIDSEFNWRSSGIVSNLLTAERIPTSIILAVTNALGAWVTDSSDPMLQSYLYPATGNIVVKLSGIPAGTYDLYVYAHGSLDTQNSIVRLNVGNEAVIEKSTTTAPGWRSEPWEAGKQFVEYRAVEITADGVLNLTIAGGAAHEADINGLQLVATQLPDPDRQPPGITISSPNSNANVPIGIFRGTVTDSSPITNASWSINGGGTVPLSLTSGSFEITGVSLTAGSNTFTVTAVDSVGNTGNSYLVVNYVPPPDQLHPTNSLVNVDFTAHLNAAFTVETGFAATGHASNDYWNVYSRDIDSPANGRAYGTVLNLLTAERDPTGMNLYITNVFGAWTSLATDPMLNSYLYPRTEGDILLQIDHVPAGTYDLYVYAHGQLSIENEIVDLEVADDHIQELITSSKPDWNSNNWVEGQQFVVFRSITVKPGSPLKVTIRGGVAGLAAINGLQLVSTATLVSDTDAPVITIVSPDTRTNGPVAQLKGSISDNFGISGAFWSLNNGNWMALPLIEGKFNVGNIGLNPGSNSLTVVAWDLSDNVHFTQLFIENPGITIVSSNMLVNVDFTAHLNPAFSVKTGPAAIGQNGSDFWNVYSRDVSTMFDWRSSGTVTNLLSAEHLPTGINLFVDNAAGAWPNGSTDPMMNSYLYSGQGNITVSLQNVPEGIYDLYVYAHGQLDRENAVIELSMGGAPSIERSTSSSAGWNAEGWKQGRQYVVFHSIQVHPQALVGLTIKGGVGGLAVLNGLQLMSPAATNIDKEAPVVTIMEPSSGTNSSVVDLSGTILDNVGIALATWSLNEGTTRNLELGSKGQFHVSNVLLRSGTNRFRVDASDFEGNVATASVSVMNLPIVPPPTNVVDTSNLLVNVDFTAHLNPAFSVKTGAAAVGHGSNDFWNVYSRDLTSEYDWQANGTVTNLITAEGQFTEINLSLENAAGAWFTDSEDAMLQSYLYPFGGDISIELDGVPKGKFDLYVYAHGLTPEQNASVALTLAGSVVKERSTSSEIQWNPATWQNGKQFVVFRSILLSSNSTVGLTVKGGVAGLAVINGLQLVSPAAVNVDSNSPVVTILSPISGLATNRTIALTGTVSDDVGVTSAYWSLNKSPWASITLSNGNFVIPTIVLNSGTNQIQVLAADGEGNQGSNSVQIIYTPSIFLSVGSGTTQEGGQAIVPIKFTGPPTVAGLTFSIDYDPMLLLDPSINWSSELGGALTSFNGNTPGHIRGAVAYPGQGFPSGLTQIAQLTMRAGSVPATRIAKLNLSITGIFDIGGNEISSDFGTESGIVEITESKVLGDNNGNNRLDIGDATLMMQYVTGLVGVQPWDLPANDLNHNGKLDLGDVIDVLRVVVGLDPQTKTVKGKLVSAGMSNSSTSGALYLTPSKLSIMPEDLLTVQVSIDGNIESVAGTSFRLQYPTNALRLIDSRSLQPGPIVPASAAVLWSISPLQNDYLVQNGNISAAISSDILWPINHGIVATFTFQVQPGVYSEMKWPLSVTDGEFSDGSQVHALMDGQTFVQTKVNASISLLSIDETVVRLHVGGELGKAYQVESSDDLKSWSPLSSGVITSSEVGATIVDSRNAEMAYRFYRVVEVP